MPIALIALAAIAVGTGISTYAGVEGAKAARKVSEARSKGESIRAARERTKQIREGRIKQAQILQAGANVGAGESSSVQSGAAGAMQSAFGNIQFINQQESIGKSITTAQQGVYRAQGVGAIGAGISDIGGAVFNNRQELGDIFSSGDK